MSSQRVIFEDDDVRITALYDDAGNEVGRNIEDKARQAEAEAQAAAAPDIEALARAIAGSPSIDAATKQAVVAALTPQA